MTLYSNGTQIYFVNGLVDVEIGAPFDYYISTTGSDTNAGTLASPWAITSLNTKGATYAGKRVGLIAGTYGVSSLMTSSGSSYNNIALDITGGTSTANTYIGSSDLAGHESPRAATIEANDNGIFGGGTGNKCSMIGQSSNVGYITISGLVLKGCSLYCLVIGQTAGTNTAPSGIIIQKNEITGCSTQGCTIASGENISCIQIMSGNGVVITNNYLHDNILGTGGGGAGDSQHFSAIYHWGLGSGANGTQITYNTIINSGCIHGKEPSQANAVIAYNYVDCSGMPSQMAGGYVSCITGFYDNATNGTVSIVGSLTSVHHNVLISYASASAPSGANSFIGLGTKEGETNWGIQYPFHVYNNTMVASGNMSGGGLSCFEQVAGTQYLTFYNNLFYDNGFNAVAQTGYMWVNKDIFSLCDYNIYGTQSPFALYSNNGTGGGFNGNPASFAAWKTDIGGDANSSQNSVNPFTSSGTFAKQYTIQSGSPAYLTGKTGGTSGGTTCNVGAWDGIITQIGCNFI